MREATAIVFAIAGAFVVATLPIALAMRESWAPWMTGVLVVATAVSTVLVPLAVIAAIAWHRAQPRYDQQFWRTAGAMFDAGRKGLAHDREAERATPMLPADQWMGDYIDTVRVAKIEEEV